MTTTLSGRAIAGPVDPPSPTGHQGPPLGLGDLPGADLLLADLPVPFLIQIGTSFKVDADATANPLNPIPQEWTLDAYRSLRQADFPLWFMNSVIVTLCVTVGRVFFDSLAGYALARLHFHRPGPCWPGCSSAIMAVPAVVLLIPKYLVLVQLGLYNSYAGMIIPLLADAAGVFIMRQFFINIPVEVEESARLDGASAFRTFWSVVLPMARPAVITLTILSFQGSWNELPHFIISRQSPDLNTLTSGVATLVSGSVGRRYPIPAEDGGRIAHDHSGGRGVLHLPAILRPGGSSGAVKG